MQTLNQLRSKIDQIDANIIKKLSTRKKLSIKIGKLKSKSKKQIKDPKREEKMRLQYEKLCLKYKLKPQFINKLFKLIISNSRELQK